MPSFTSFGTKKVNAPPEKPTKSRMTIILTGSTGSLGSYLLDTLVRSSKVERVICLNRSSDAEQRQWKSHRARGLSTELGPPKIEFLECDTTKDFLGLSELVYSSLTSEATHILHNAWPVDFNRAFTSFEPQIRGVKQLLDFATRCTYDVTFFFISSISVAARWGATPGSRERVPEKIIEDWRVASMGYGQSKLVSERLLAEASKTTGVKTAICRVGQVGGPVLHGQNGQWNKQEWLPSLIASSKHLKLLPSSLGPLETIDWIPVDLLAQVVVDLLPCQMELSQRRSKSQTSSNAVYHIVNPRTCSWHSLLPAIVKHLGGDVAIVEFTEWVTALQKNMSETPDYALNPAAKLFEFYSNLADKAVRFPKARSVTLETKQTVQYSPTLRALNKVSFEWMDLWMQQWAF
ncbi:NAD(P)-binding protein [Viridothelium virens]|uniref:NAD(P)-binding protein n=1 Tax=Viridothelium virens TaxID=1048519 RepID=A0A6A6HA28_VIRVR|nr:NAD(P)-binding protein [Viridothelium virens]